MPPMTMIPLIALVTLMSGVCSAGDTFQITCQPTTQASRKTVRCWMNSGGPKIAAAPSRIAASAATMFALLLFFFALGPVPAAAPCALLPAGAFELGAAAAAGGAAGLG